jgi:hypothetical protein
LRDAQLRPQVAVRVDTALRPLELAKRTWPQTQLPLIRVGPRITAQLKPEAKAYGVSYLYPFSRRTLLYAIMGWMDNNAAGNFRLKASSRQVALPVTAGLDTKALTLGITHRF